MSNGRCEDTIICKNGDCKGCKNGKINCNDTRCAPYCPGCGIPENHDFNGSMVIIIILLCLIAILFIVWFVYGPQLIHPHNNDELANIAN